MAKKMRWWVVALLPLALLVSCGKKDKTLKIQASSTPHAEILAFIQPEVEKEGVVFQIVVLDDYNLPNRALAEGEIDANFFQHRPFLEAQMDAFHYDLSVLSSVHVEPLAIYAKGGSWDNVKKGGVITVPSDPTNEGRALLLLQKAGIITVKEGVSYPTLLDVVDNPYGCVLKEIDAAFLSRTVSEVAASVIPTNYALLGGVHAEKNVLLLEEPTDLYANVVAVQKKQADREEFSVLKKHLESEKTKQYIRDRYNGVIAPVSQ